MIKSDNNRFKITSSKDVLVSASENMNVSSAAMKITVASLNLNTDAWKSSELHFGGDLTLHASRLYIDSIYVKNNPDSLDMHWYYNDTSIKVNSASTNNVKTATRNDIELGNSVARLVFDEYGVYLQSAAINSENVNKTEENLARSFYTISLTPSFNYFLRFANWGEITGMSVERYNKLEGTFTYFSIDSAVGFPEPGTHPTYTAPGIVHVKWGIQLPNPYYAMDFPTYGEPKGYIASMRSGAYVNASISITIDESGLLVVNNPHYNYKNPYSEDDIMGGISDEKIEKGDWDTPTGKRIYIYGPGNFGEAERFSALDYVTDMNSYNSGSNIDLKLQLSNPHGSYADHN